MVNKLLITGAIVALFIFFLCYFLLIPNVTNGPDSLAIECPGEQFVAEAGLTWTREYDEKYPDSTMEAKIADWNRLLVDMKCDEYQVTVDDVYYSGILSDLIHSTTTDNTVCPTLDESSYVFEQWSVYFIKGNPNYTKKDIVEGWDELMVQNGCVELVGSVRG